ncbi:hypothetical protein SK128_007598 [Halocaridina rubra]|uniref:Uncharacterized protein n=1 Tax=Halocaridina rubra TaxID=373956 RepID=A0AAN8WKW0_HALRR
MEAKVNYCILQAEVIDLILSLIWVRDYLALGKQFSNKTLNVGINSCRYCQGAARQLNISTLKEDILKSQELKNKTSIFDMSPLGILAFVLLGLMSIQQTSASPKDSDNVAGNGDGNRYDICYIYDDFEDGSGDGRRTLVPGLGATNWCIPRNMPFFIGTCRLYCYYWEWSLSGYNCPGYCNCCVGGWWLYNLGFNGRKRQEENRLQEIEQN